MRGLYKLATDELKSISEDIRMTTEKKQHIRERSAMFIEEHRASSRVQKRIDAVRRSIQHKPQSDQ